MSISITPPTPDEFAPFYSPYIASLPEGDIVDLLDRQREDVASALNWVASESWGTFRYEPGKWSVADVVCHMSDAERISSYRALRISRGDKTPLPGWEQDDYAFVAGAEGREVDNLAEEFDLVRRSTLALVRSWEIEALDRKAVANDHPITVRALVYIMAGHVHHHMNILRNLYRVKG